jgi:hypothetical protein
MPIASAAPDAVRAVSVPDHPLLEEGAVGSECVAAAEAAGGSCTGTFAAAARGATTGFVVVAGSKHLTAASQNKQRGGVDHFPRAMCCIAGALAVALRSLRRYAPDKYRQFVVCLQQQHIMALDIEPEE